MVKVSVKVDVSELVDLAKKFEEFFDPSIAKPSPLGKAVAAGARDVYFKLQEVTPVAKAGEAKDPGLLRDSVYRYWDPEKSPDGNHINYKVGINLKKAPHFHLANDGHDVYENYRPFMFPPHWTYKSADTSGAPRWFGTPTISRNKRGKNRLPRGPVAYTVKGKHFLEKAFSNTQLQKAMKIIFDEYVHQFNETVGRK